MSSGYLGILGIILDCKWIAEIEKAESQKTLLFYFVIITTYPQSEVYKITQLRLEANHWAVRLRESLHLRYYKMV